MNTHTVTVKSAQCYPQFLWYSKITQLSKRHFFIMAHQHGSWLLELVDDCIDFVSVYNVNKRKINVLCFGDSLTKGYANGGLEYYPYSETLNDLMRQHVAANNEYHRFGITYSIHVSNVGVNGESISDTMHDRLLRILTQSDVVFDAVIINGGTNDIYCGYSAEKIWNNKGAETKSVDAVDFLESTSSIHQIYEMVKGYTQNPDIMTVAVTVPPFHLATDSMVRNTDRVNQLIRGYCAETRNAKRMVLCDLAAEFPSFSMKPQYWDPDGCHFSEDGYALFGQIVFVSMRHWITSKISI